MVEFATRPVLKALTNIMAVNMSTRIFLLLAAAAGIVLAEDLPLIGTRPRRHSGLQPGETRELSIRALLGLDNAFTTNKDDGSVFVAYMKVNDHQFIELFPGLKAEDTIPMTHIAMWTEDLEKTRKIMISRGLAPTEIHKGPRDHNLSCSLRQLPGQNLVFLEFVQYMPDSLHMLSKGKALGERRLSTHLEHAGIVTTDVDAALKFYVGPTGLQGNVAPSE